MRIPRFAFALMLVVIVTLSTGLVLVGAKEKAEPIFQFQIKSPSNSNAPNGMGVTYNFSLTDLSKNEGCKNDGCGLAQDEPDGMLVYVIRLLDSNDGAAKIGIRAQKIPLNPNEESSEQERLSAIAQVRKTPENVNWYIPGQKVRIPVEGFESYEITGQLFDKIPDAINPALQPYLPKEGVMRINSPVLLQENELVYNFNGCASSVGGDGNRSDGIFLYVPGMGKFLFSPHDFAGAVEGKRSNSQVGFTSNGQSYLLLTGAPIAAGEQEGKIWVAHFPNFMPKHHQDSAACGGGPINMLVSSQQ